MSALNGDRIALAVGKPLALLAYLALAAEPVRRESLAALLWGGSPGDRGNDRARASLRQALWTLRKAVGAEKIVGDDLVALARGAFQTDIVTLQAALKRGDLNEALTVWGGIPLFGLEFPDAPEWERWADERRYELQGRLGTACWAEGSRRRDPSRGRAGIDLLERARDLVPDRLQVHVDLTEALLDLRSFGEAEAALVVARGVFDDDAARVRLSQVSERIDLLQGGRPGRRDRSPTQGTLIGREAEYRALLRRWRLAVQGTSGVGLLIGPTGIGKTRLAEELRRVAEAEGARVAVLKAEDSERPIEWGVLAEIVQQLFRLSGSTGISPASDAVLRSLIPSLAVGDGGGAEDTGPRGTSMGLLRTRPSAALADALTDLITAVSEDAPLLLVLDDLHWADTESRAVLTRVATRLNHASAFLLLTCRTDVEEPRVRKTLALLSESASTTTVELAPLSLDETEALFRSQLRFEPEGGARGLLQRIHRTTRGNPLFLLELLKLFEEEGIIEFDDSGARIFFTARLPPEIPLPESVRALVERQLDQLSNEAALVAAHLARVGHAASPRLLGLQTGRGTSGVTNGIGELLQRRLIRWDRGETLTFTHDELRAAVAGRYQMHVGLTTGGGAQWSFFRSMVLVTLGAFLLGGMVLFSNQGGTFGRKPHGGGVLVTTGPDGALAAYRLEGPFGDVAKVSSPSAGVRPPQVVTVSSSLGGHDLYFSLADGTQSPRFAHLDDVPALVRVSADLTKVAWVEPGVPDRVLVAATGGALLTTASRTQVLDLVWCGRGRLILLARAGDGVEALSWTPGVNEPTPIPLHGVHPGQSLACSPDERTLALVGARNGRMGLFLHDLASGTTEAIDLPGHPRLAGVSWNLPAERPIPIGIRMVPEGPLEVGIGGQRALRAQIEKSDGSLHPATLAWRSEDPEIATVSPSGVISAVRPGRVRIEGVAAGWLAGSIEVEVLTDTEATPRLRALVGQSMAPPTPEPVEGGASGPETPVPDGWSGNPIWEGEFEGQWFPRTRPFALRLESGAGRLAETLVMDAREGITLELEFRISTAAAGPDADATPSLEGTRPFIEACMSQDDGPESACLRYPASAGPRWNPAEISVFSGPAFPPLVLSLPSPRPPSGWVRAALTVSATGTVALFVDERPLGSAPLRVSEMDATGWRLTILGEAGAGSLEVRRVRVWEGVRYQLPP